MFTPFNALAAALWLYLPALIANATPVLVGKAAFLAPYRRPIWEAGLGKNKSWAGLVIGVIAGTLAGWLQIAFTPWPYEPWLWIAWSALISFGALFADAAKSYLKRRMGIPPGSALPVVDGIDYVVGALVFGLVLFVPSWQVALALLVAGPILSLLANVVSYSLGLKKVWY
jgi:CDP-2,3-bis-(O-geranylgeranyl)-sn-glycerol synthase